MDGEETGEKAKEHEETPGAPLEDQVKAAEGSNSEGPENGQEEEKDQEEADDGGEQEDFRQVLYGTGIKCDLLSILLYEIANILFQNIWQKSRMLARMKWH